jgi:hypothetical protein
MMYGYLLPNVTVGVSNIFNHLRKDGKGGAGLLRVNRQIYNELYHDWYGSTTFRLDILKDTIAFLNHHILPGDSMDIKHMPTTLKAVKSLLIDMISFENWEQETPKAIMVLDELFSSGNCTLKQFRLTLDLGTFAGLSFVYRKNEEQSQCRFLEDVLEPLQSIRGLSEVQIVVDNPRIDDTVDYRRNVYNHFHEMSRKYLDELEKMMMLPVLGGEDASANAGGPSLD